MLFLLMPRHMSKKHIGPMFLFFSPPWCYTTATMELTTRLAQLPRVGKSTVARLERLGLRTVYDLLYYFPFRYEDFRQCLPIKQLIEGQAVTVKGRIELIANRRSFKTRKTITEALVSDESGSLRVIWFNQPFITNNLASGDAVYLSGVVKSDMLGPQLVGPTYEKVVGEAVHTARLVPVYGITEGLPQKQIRQMVKYCVDSLKEVPDWVPDIIKERFDLPPLIGAIHGIHFPSDDAHLAESTRRLKFDELFLLQLQAEIARRDRVASSAPALVFQETNIKEFVAKLPFTLTKTQKIATWEILKDIAEPRPMNRLLSGDVGSGKTVVAAIALYNTALNGFQGVLMAPTEILASQHFEGVSKLLSTLPVALVTRTQRYVSDNGVVTKVTKKALHTMLAEGKIAVSIGTHALLTEAVHFKQLGLVIVDEQHRFGVMQRKIMKDKGAGAHFLSMTATPIPRSLALMLYGDLEVSIISELPPGRKKIITKVVEPAKREKAYGFIRDQVKAGRQVFVVCPLIEGVGQGTVEKKSVMMEYEKLSTIIFPDLKVGFLHGKLKPEEKEAVMEQFEKNEIHILVSTSVIEVGVNIPNASIMMIEGADRFGLAQLHQFRGRVGRSSYQSYCLLFTDNTAKAVVERLGYFEAHHDGFALAEKDLEIRGPGQMYGVEQSGSMRLRLATLSDSEIVKQAREAARGIAPNLANYPPLQKMLHEVEQSLHLE